MNGPVAYWARATLRRDVAGLALVTLPVALGPGGAMGAAVGARRTATPGERLLSVSNVPHVRVQASDAAALNGGLDLSEGAQTTAGPALPLQPSTVPSTEAPEHYFRTQANTVGEPFTVAQPWLLEVRLTDPAAPAEAVRPDQHPVRLKLGVRECIALVLGRSRCPGHPSHTRSRLAGRPVGAEPRPSPPTKTMTTSPAIAAPRAGASTTVPMRSALSPRLRRSASMGAWDLSRAMARWGRWSASEPPLRTGRQARP